MTEKSIALGTFDGFHKGHTAVTELAKQSAYPAFVLLFSQHPMSVITGKAPKELVTDNIRSKLIGKLQITPIVTDFKKIYSLSPEEFFENILVKELNAKELSCGKNYTFGKGGKGDINILKRLCAENEIKLNIADMVTYKDKAVSSTRIRKALENGEIEDANKMLGRAFSYDFTVIHGDARGRTLGFPTLNQIIPDGFVKLKYGVYASAVCLNGKFYPSVTNFGIRPTIGTDSVYSETNIHGFSGDLYGKNVEVFILSFMRSEKRFSSLEELSAAISADSERSYEIFKEHLALLR